jgi:hypothetical protein
VTVAELVDRFDDAVSAMESIADVLERIALILTVELRRRGADANTD